MVKKKRFLLKKSGVKGEYWGNKVSGRVIIFSHGFGVKRDSRGMFTDLGELLKDDCLVVLFDYVDVNKDGSTTAYSFSEQAEKLKAVISYIRNKFDPERVEIVAHSQGCIIVGLVSPEGVDKVVLVAGPISAPGQGMKDYFSQREGTIINKDKVSQIKRSDGSLTFVPPEYWEEARRVNPAALYKKLAEKSRVSFLRVRQDQMVVGENYSLLREGGRVGYFELDGNHDFENEARKPFLEKIVFLLK